MWPCLAIPALTPPLRCRPLAATAQGTGAHLLWKRATRFDQNHKPRFETTSSAAARTVARSRTSLPVSLRGDVLLGATYWARRGELHSGLLRSDAGWP